VHHGDIGTVAQGLAAGTPQLSQGLPRKNGALETSATLVENLARTHLGTGG